MPAHNSVDTSENNGAECKKSNQEKGAHGTTPFGHNSRKCELIRGD